MTMPDATDAAPLDETLTVPGAAETRGHGGTPSGDGLSLETNAALLARLRDIYAQQGIEIHDGVLEQSIAALAEGRLGYTPPRGPAAALARVYVGRDRWGPPVVGVLVALALGLGAYFFGYQPYRAAQAEQARVELAESLPAQMDALYQSIFNETKVQTAATDADELRNRGRDAAAKGDRAAAEQAIADLMALLDRLEQTYRLVVVDRDGVKPGFWTFPPNNSEATNFYVVVEAVDTGGKTLSLPVTNEDTGKTETVSRWGVRVPEAVYDAVIADKADNGVIEHNLVGIKQDGFTDVDYTVPVLGGTLTQW